MSDIHSILQTVREYIDDDDYVETKKQLHMIYTQIKEIFGSSDSFETLPKETKDKILKNNEELGKILEILREKVVSEESSSEHHTVEQIIDKLRGRIADFIEKRSYHITFIEPDFDRMRYPPSSSELCIRARGQLQTRIRRAAEEYHSELSAKGISIVDVVHIACALEYFMNARFSDLRGYIDFYKILISSLENNPAVIYSLCSIDPSQFLTEIVDKPIEFFMTEAQIETRRKNIKHYSELLHEEKRFVGQHTDRACKRCKKKCVFQYQMQFRSGDEAMTQCFECTACGHEWREND
ncbi:hypothetical protein ADUPG1_007740 [Aduncisulcus paluster]|uniref:TFIIS-type domain-containing protein n=1 Tax=Aduncisulcus paluster TaxID=2918883 RepID=A0ABQ5KPF7_9EUKA|nr:hypothetical protein ADUPG1_007740 [Aduncisulcus paluster]